MDWKHIFICILDTRGAVSSVSLDTVSKILPNPVNIRDLNCISHLFAANVLEGIAIEVVGRRPDEPGELVALTNEAIILNIDVAFLIGVDLKNMSLTEFTC